MYSKTVSLTVATVLVVILASTYWPVLSTRTVQVQYILYRKYSTVLVNLYGVSLYFLYYSAAAAVDVRCGVDQAVEFRFQSGQSVTSADRSRPRPVHHY